LMFIALPISEATEGIDYKSFQTLQYAYNGLYLMYQ